MTSSDIVLAITGASGSAFAVRLLDLCLAANRSVHLTISPAATQVFQQELQLTVDLRNFRLEALFPDRTTLAPDHPYAVLCPPRVWDGQSGKLHYHPVGDYRAGIASGSFLTAAMVICPCSMGTLASLAAGLSQNLIHRAADVHLKERRKLIVVPRETPLSAVALGNMQRLAELGVVVLPAMPGWYHAPRSLHDLVDFVVARIADQLGLPNNLIRRWGGSAADRGAE